MITPHIFDAVGLTQRQGNRNFVGTGLHRCLTAAQVGHQHRNHQIFVTERAFDHGRRIGHLRQQLWRDKGADFDLSDTRAILCFDPGELSLRREDCLNALQAIAGADLANRNLCHHASLIDGCRGGSLADSHHHLAMITPAHQLAEGVGGGSEPVVHFFISDQFTRLSERHKFLLEGRAL